MLERVSSGFAVEFSSGLERSEILCEAVFWDASMRRSVADNDSLPPDLTAGVVLNTNHASKTQIQALPEKLERC